MKTKYLIVLILGFLLLASLFGCTQAAPISPPPTPAPTPATQPQQEVYDIKTDSSGVKYIVDPDKIVGGGPPKDGIPSIDNPRFVTLDEADQWIEDNELVLGIIYKGVKRVYPLQIMVWHEIVNDVISGDPLLITY
jgi:predicted small lipoprotein YifL